MTENVTASKGSEEMECPKCGTHNFDSAERCRICGQTLHETKAPSGPAKICQFCKTLNEPDAPFCTSCGRYLGAAETKTSIKKEKRRKDNVRRYDDYPASAKRTAWCSFAGIIMIMAAMVVVLDIAFTSAESLRETQTASFDRASDQYPVLKTFLANIFACQAIRMVFAVLTFVGAIAATRRLNFGLAIVGAVSGILGLMMSISALVFYPWLLIIGSMFGGELLALGMIALSKREFQLV